MDNMRSMIMSGDDVMQSSLAGRLDNTSLSASNIFLPIFECVANSIHAIEDRGVRRISDGSISVYIQRVSQEDLFDDADVSLASPIISVEVIDNGIGFTDDNFNSFKELDTNWKRKRGCRGIGRLLWLKAFRKVEVNSFYRDTSGKAKKRSFTFDREREVDNVHEEPLDGNKFTYRTSVLLKDFIYNDKKTKKTSTIASEMLKHFLWYFMRPEGAPEIIVKDNLMDEPVCLNSLYEEQISKGIKKEHIEIKHQDFYVYHIELSCTSSPINASLLYCAEDRIVKKVNLEKNIQGYFGKTEDEKGQRGYACIITSQYLDKHVLSDRTGFDIEDEPSDFLPESLSYKSINEAVFLRISKYLKSTIEHNKKAGIKRVKDYVEKRAPRYKFLLSKMESGNIYINPAFTEKELDSALHAELFKAEQEVIKEGHELLSVPQELTKEYYNKLSGYMEKAGELKQSDLAAYVARRRVILDLLERLLKRKSDGGYYNEEFIHSLIMPMRKESTEIFSDQENLWIIDERLTFHHYLASDKTISSYPINVSSGKEPDIGVLNSPMYGIFDNPILTSETENSPSAITIVEFKKPMRPGLEKKNDDPIRQVKEYLLKIRDGNAETKDGRPLRALKDLPGFCFVICDLTPEYQKECIYIHNMTLSSDQSFLYSHERNTNAYYEVIPYETLLQRAKERNRAFFDKLGLPCI